jgi:hypothetical protein
MKALARTLKALRCQRSRVKLWKGWSNKDGRVKCSLDQPANASEELLDGAIMRQFRWRVNSYSTFIFSMHKEMHRGLWAASIGPKNILERG